ncbi:MAG: ACP S-malonyltransferase [Planctomycetales bacterium]|nr:ACP S-malonyltransferase [Planctomycetales bacterium]
MAIDLNSRLKNAVFAFRGYNVTNLGKTPQLLAHPQYGPIVESYLTEASETCRDIIGRPVDLVQRVRDEKETELADYAEAIALIVAVEQAQIKLLEEFHGVSYQGARLATGFSLGEISALVAGGVYAMSDALKIPLEMSTDGIDLAADVTLGVLFSRNTVLPMDKIERLFLEINNEGKGMIGMSTILSPNSILVLGTGKTLDRFRKRVREVLPRGVHLRRNENKWPPLHTSIMWERHIPDRASKLLRTLPGGFVLPSPPILSHVTGDISYTETNSRELIRNWIDHPQRLWDVICKILAMGIKTVIHVGPAPNIIPATFGRLAVDIEAQTKGSRGMRALSVAIRRPWLQALLPSRAALLRAPHLEHIILEDWLLGGPLDDSK